MFTKDLIASMSGGGSGKFTFHIIQTAQYNIKPIEGFAIAADRQLIPSSENIIFVDRFSTEETSFYKSYDKQVLLDAMHSASLIADKMPLLGVLSYSLYILYTNSWLSVNDTVIFEKYGVLHYSVPNMPGAVPHTSTMALSNATLPYILRLANKGIRA